MDSVDSIFLEVVGNHLAATAEEMGLALVRSAYSPNIRERRDCSCAVFDSSGRVISQAEHIPAHLGPMASAVRCLQESASAASVRPGDVFIYNDSFLPGGSHLPDIATLAPVFIGGRLGFYVVSRAHHSDIGGIVPGSMGIQAKEIFHEGLRIPLVRLVNEGKLAVDIMDLICLNSRSPEERYGDVLAQLAALEVGKARLEEFTQRYELNIVQVYIEALLELARQSARDLFRDLPPGPFGAEDYLEVGEDESLKIQVQIRVNSGYMELDFDGTDAQVELPYNLPVDMVQSAGYYVLKCLVGPDVPFNQGIIECMKFMLPQGSLVNPRPPAPVALCTSEAGNRVVDVILAALGAVLPDRVTAGWASTRNIMLFSGVRLDESGTSFIHLESFGGGQGGRPTKDGLDGVPPHLGNTANIPTEIMEDLYPLLGLRFGLRRGSEGPGQYRGGLGLVREILVRDARDAKLTILSERRRFPPPGLFGGREGAVGQQWLIRGGELQPLPAKGTVSLLPGDIVRMETPGGGGYGPVKLRSFDHVTRDVATGLLTPERASTVYGI